jgi:hypothetical protein
MLDQNVMRIRISEITLDKIGKITNEEMKKLGEIYYILYGGNQDVTIMVFISLTKIKVCPKKQKKKKKKKFG